MINTVNTPIINPVFITGIISVLFCQFTSIDTVDNKNHQNLKQNVVLSDIVFAMLLMVSSFKKFV